MLMIDTVSHIKLTLVKSYWQIFKWYDKKSNYCSKVIETKFNKTLIISEKGHEDFNNSAKCWICEKAKAYQEGEVKVKDHDRVTAKHQGSTHQECNLDLSLNKKIPVVFHNLQNCDSHLTFQEIGKYIWAFLFNNQKNSAFF